jgi:mono/diheme cytochrome c family protein
VRGAGTVAFLAAGVLLTACGQDDKPAPTADSKNAGTHTTAGAPGAAAGDPAKGKQVWLGQCVACHNVDPAKDGPIGPAVKGASKDLLEDRVLRGTYPPGYQPKRETKVMPPRPDLVASIPDLAAYLR